jgi:UDP-N-acetylmuramyl pentapeptide phosphotransferase/UDP-N-acetylglucosamine-1-phosphate transferase
LVRAALVGVGAVAARAALDGLRRTEPPDWTRSNFRGRAVSLVGGPALAAAATISAAAGAGAPTAAAAALVAGGGAGAVGWYDDIVGARPEQKSAKGIRGHLAALREGRVTSGVVKVAGVGAAGLVAAAMVDAGEPRRRGPLGRIANVALGGGVIAGSANLVNLLDLRPGRALKAGTLAAMPMLAGPAGGLVAGPIGAAASLLPADLREEIMLGDAGANAHGALIGLAITARSGPWRRAAVLAGIAALTAASEKVSFTAVIEATPVLRDLDALGRRTDRDEPVAGSQNGA